MSSCEFILQITAITCALAKGKSDDDIALLSSLFSQIGSSLATMLAYDAACCPKDETSENSTGTSDAEDFLHTL